MVAPSVLYEKIRRRLDLADSSYPEDDELGQIVEESFFDLWDFLIDKLGPEAPWERQTLATVAGQEHVDVTVAQGVYRVLRLDFKGSGNAWAPMRPLNMFDASLDDQAGAWNDARDIRYFARRSLRADDATRAVGGGFSAWRFHFSPKPSAIYSWRLWYVPAPAITFATGEGSYYASFPDDFPEFIVPSVCAKIAGEKEELDESPHLRALERAKERITRFTSPHQMNAPQTISDLRRYQDDDIGSPFWRRRG